MEGNSQGTLMRLEEARFVGFEATPPLRQGIYPPVCRVGEFIVRTMVLSHGALAIAKHHDRSWLTDAARNKEVAVLTKPLDATSTSVALCIAEKNVRIFSAHFKIQAAVLAQPFLAAPLDLGKAIALLGAVFRAVPDQDLTMRDELCGMMLASCWLRSAGSTDSFGIVARTIYRQNLQRDPKRIKRVTDLMKIFLRRFGRPPPPEITI
jgi:hypothetical protein